VIRTSELDLTSALASSRHNSAATGRQP